MTKFISEHNPPRQRQYILKVFMKYIKNLSEMKYGVFDYFHSYIN